VREEEDVAMALPAWHKVMEPIHHNHPLCAVGQEALGVYLRKGPGGKPLCKECARLNGLEAAVPKEKSESNLEDAMGD
jgi:hypothetical protein